MREILYTVKDNLFYMALGVFTLYNLVFLLEIYSFMELSMSKAFYEASIVFNFLLSVTILFYLNRIKPILIEMAVGVIYVIIIFTYISLFLFTDFGLRL